MALISLSGVRKSFGASQILDEITFTIGVGEKVALVGPNGCGKTTVLRIIAGLDEPDSGQMQILPGTTIGYMPQDSELDGTRTLVEEVSNASVEVLELEARLRRLESAMEMVEGRDLTTLLEEYGEAQHEFERLGGYAFEAEVKSALDGLGLGPEHWDKPVGVLSGGQKTRAALAKLLLLKPDVLLLDEPTNHLDIQACEWLEEFLQDFPGAVLVVSHDRYFLDRVVTKVVDLHQGVTRSYPGNYTAYTKQRQEFLRQQLENYERQQQEIARLEDFIARYHAGQRHREAKSRQKKLEKMARIQKPRLDSRKPHLRLDTIMISGHVVADIRGLGKSFGDKILFQGLDLLVERGDRIGLVGPNGAGKTTLLRMILGEEEPDTGTISLGYAVEIGYFAQDLSELDPENTVLDELLETHDMTPAEARNLLARFLFTGDDVFKVVSALSGGERNRLVLAKLMLKQSNVLLLDEPTNHLDIDSRQALDEALRDFEGTIILSSHDRYLLNSVTNKTVAISNGCARVYEGNYDSYATRARQFKPRPPKRKPKPQTRQPVRTRTRSPRPEDYEGEIEAVETRLAEITNILGRPETYTDGTLVTSLQAEYTELSIRLEQLYDEWEKVVESSAET